MTKSTIVAFRRTDRLVAKTMLPAIAFGAGVVCGIVAASTDKISAGSPQTAQTMRGPEDVSFAAKQPMPKAGHDPVGVASLVPIPAVFTPSPQSPALKGVTAPQSAPEAALLKVLADQRCLAEAMYYEARGEGAAGEEAIAEVVFHRTHARGYPHSVCGVVYEGASLGHCQFSFACNGNGETDRPKEPAAWYQARILAAKIMAGAVPLADVTEGAISFHAVDVQPGWNDHLERTIQIGNHVFYRKSLGTRQS